MYPLLILGVVCAFLLAGVVGEGFVIKGKTAEVTAAKAETASATERANQNYAATQQCFAQVEQDKASIALQNDALETMRAKANDMERAAVNLETEKALLLQTLDDRTQETEAEAKGAPGDVRGLGPIVLKRVAGLWE